MGDATDQLLRTAGAVTRSPAGRELDLLLSTGEVVSATLLVLALGDRGVDAVSLTGSQCGLTTDARHGSASVTGVDTTRLRKELDAGLTVIVTGFQGLGPDGELRTLGRGGSDVSAVAIAGALDTSRCEIFTDVDGVYTADPRLVASARLIDELSSREMLAFARQGAQVLQPRSLRVAQQKEVDLIVARSFGSSVSTIVRARTTDEASGRVRGIAARADVLRIRIAGQRDVAESLREADVLMSRPADDGIDVLVCTGDMATIEPFCERLRREFAQSVIIDTDVAAVGTVGIGLGRSAQPEIRHALDDAGIPVHTVFREEDCVTCIVDGAAKDEALRALHRALIDDLNESSVLRRRDDGRL